MDLATEPQTFTVEEAARILRIGRTTAYALAREWRATCGASGLPVLELGRSLRVPRAALVHLLTAPPIAAPEPTPSATPARSVDDHSQGTLWAGEPSSG
jgi:excisionase family DNA binding protein